MPPLYFASGNVHKKQEIEALFPGIPIRLPGEEGIDFRPEETGATFLENSLIKARALWEAVHAPVLADDSGLCVDALGGRPGIFSARYGGDISAREKNIALLEEVHRTLAGAGGNRRCRFVCALVLFFNPDRFFAAQETLEGTLVESIAAADKRGGTGGFGYDPIVLVEGLCPRKTVAQLTPAEKNEQSHRGKAAAALKALWNLHALGG